MTLKDRGSLAGSKAATAITVAVIAISISIGIGSLSALSYLWAFAVVGIVLLAGVGFTLKVEYLLYAAIFLITVDAYRVPLQVINISLFRILLFLLIVRFIFGTLVGEFRIRKLDYNFVIVLYTLSLVLSLLLSENLSLAQDYLFNTIAGISMVFMLPSILVRKEQLYKALFSLVASSIAVVFYCGYTYYEYFSRGIVTADYPFRNLIPFALASAGHIGARSASMGFPRLAIPFGPPQLSLFLAVNLILVIGFGMRYAKKQQQRWLAMSISVLLLVLLIGTISRSGWMAFLGGLVCLLIVAKRFRGKILIWSILGFLLAASIIYIVIPTEVILNRVTSAAISGIQSHLDQRLRAFDILVTDLKTFFVGIGLGNYPLYTGARHSHSSYTTILAERGISGGLLFLLLYAFPLILLFRRLHTHPSYHSVWFACKATLLSMLLAIVVGFVFYELDGLMVVWLSLGLASSAIAIDRRNETKREGVHGYH